MHPKVKEFYEKNNIDVELETVQDKLEKKFLKDTALSDKKITIESIYRVKLGGLKSSEHVYYTEKWTATDRKGNAAHFIKLVGKFEQPTADFHFDDEGVPRAAGISDFKTVYEIKWDPKLIDEFEEKEMLTETTQCYIYNGSRTYGNFFMENFRARDFEDLLVYGQSGRFPTLEEKEMIVGPPSKRMGQSAAK